MKIEKNPRTDIDVELLQKVFPDLQQDGREITHEQLETVLHMSRAQSRYRTVVNKWRRNLLRERGVWLDGQVAQGRGFVVLTPDEMVRYGNRGVRAAGRKLYRSLAILSAPREEQLSEDLRRHRSLLEAAIERMRHEHQTTLREVGKALKPMRQLPRKAS